MDLSNFNSLKSEFANLTHQLKSSIESTSYLLNDLDTVTPTSTINTTNTAATSNLNFNLNSFKSNINEFKSNANNNNTTSSTSITSNSNLNFDLDSTNNLLNSINNLKATTLTTALNTNIEKPAELKIEENKADLLHELNVTSRIKYLEEELANAQADKEFVWSLWRQLQSTNPDLTNAIGSVVQREKEKYEAKDKKYEELLKSKDQKLDELKINILAKQTELNQLNDKIKELDAKLVEKNDEISLLKINSKTFEDKEQMYEQMLRGKDDKVEKFTREFENEKQHLILRIKDLVNELAVCQEKDMESRLECEQQKQTIDLLNKQIKQVNNNYESLMSELNEFKTSVDNSLKLENEKLRADAKSKTEKNEHLRNELDELWNKFNLNVDYIGQQDKIIKQLKSIQNELHKTIKNQQKTFQNENDELRKMYEQISKKYEECMNSEASEQKKQKILQLQQIKISEKSTKDLIKAQQYEIDQLKLQLDLQLEQLNDKKQVCEELNKKLEAFSKETSKNKSGKRQATEERVRRRAEKSEINFLKRSKSVNHKNRNSDYRKSFSFESDDEKKALSRSKSVDRNIDKRLTSKKNSFSFSDDEDLLENYDENTRTDRNAKIEKIKLYYENLCQAKDDQLETMRIAHQRRLERLLSLEKQYKLLKEHLKSYMDKENEKLPIEEKQPTLKAANDLNEKNSTEMANIGYTRKDSESLWNEIKFLRVENKNLLTENLELKEEVDLLKVKCDSQREEIEKFKVELNLNLTDEHEHNQKIKEKYEREMKQMKERFKQSNEEIGQLRFKLNEIEAKCEDLVEEKMKYVDISTSLTEQNKKLHKKLYQLRKTDNKFRMLLIEQMNKYSQARNKRKVFRKNESNKIGNNKNKFLLSLVSNSSKQSPPSSLSSSILTTTNDANSNPIEKSNYLKNNFKDVSNKFNKLKFNKQEKTIEDLKKQIDTTGEQKTELINKINKLAIDNEKLAKNIEVLELKVKHLKAQSEISSNELANYKKKELDFKEKEESMKKQEEQVRDELKKNFESKIKQLNADLSKQINSNKTLKTDNEKLTDKLKINEEKLNHTDRDNNQKKQLIEFYKKKIDEFNAKEKTEAASKFDDSNEPVNDLKNQIKKLNETNEKSKTEVKSLRTRIQAVLSEKTSLEQKLSQIEKSSTDANDRLESLKKEKLKLENSLRQAKSKVNELESYINELENVAESKIKNLSDVSQQTLAVAQFRLKYAYKFVDNYEKIIRFLYESLVNRSIELKKSIKNEKRVLDKSSKTIENKTIDENMKMAMNLASSVLNLTSNELDDIMSTSLSVTNNDRSKLTKEDIKEEELGYKKLSKKLLFEFDQCLNEGKKEKPMDAVDIDQEEGLNKNICELIVKRLNDVLTCERELALIKNN